VGLSIFIKSCSQSEERQLFDLLHRHPKSLWIFFVCTRNMYGSLFTLPQSCQGLTTVRQANLAHMLNSQWSHQVRQVRRPTSHLKRDSTRSPHTTPNSSLLAPFNQCYLTYIPSNLTLSSAHCNRPNQAITRRFNLFNNAQWPTLTG